jgi:hypothetical protein
MLLQEPLRESISLAAEEVNVSKEYAHLEEEAESCWVCVIFFA